MGRVASIPWTRWNGVKPVVVLTFEDFVNNLDLSVGLRVVWGGKLMGEA
jgi:hypothetical protein